MLFSCLLNISNQLPHGGSTTNAHTETILFLISYPNKDRHYVLRCQGWDSGHQPSLLPPKHYPDLWIQSQIHILFSIDTTPNSPHQEQCNSSNALSTSRCAQSLPSTAWVVFLQLKSVVLHFHEDEIQSLQHVMMGPHYSQQYLCSCYGRIFRSYSAPCSLSLSGL